MHLIAALIKASGLNGHSTPAILHSPRRLGCSNSYWTSTWIFLDRIFHWKRYSQVACLIVTHKSKSQCIQKSVTDKFTLLSVRAIVDHQGVVNNKLANQIRLFVIGHAEWQLLRCIHISRFFFSVTDTETTWSTAGNFLCQPINLKIVIQNSYIQFEKTHLKPCYCGGEKFVWTAFCK